MNQICLLRTKWRAKKVRKHSPSQPMIPRWQIQHETGKEKKDWQPQKLDWRQRNRKSQKNLRSHWWAQIQSQLWHGTLVVSCTNQFIKSFVTRIANGTSIIIAPNQAPLLVPWLLLVSTPVDSRQWNHVILVSPYLQPALHQYRLNQYK